MRQKEDNEKYADHVMSTFVKFLNVLSPEYSEDEILETNACDILPKENYQSDIILDCANGVGSIWIKKVIEN
jgi:hypothetical protein